MSDVEPDLDFANSVPVRSQGDFKGFFLASRMRVLELPVSSQTAKITESGNSIKSVTQRALQLSLQSVCSSYSTVHNTTYRNVKYCAMYSL